MYVITCVSGIIDSQASGILYIILYFSDVTRIHRTALLVIDKNETFNMEEIVVGKAI